MVRYVGVIPETVVLKISLLFYPVLAKILYVPQNFQDGKLHLYKIGKYLRQRYGKFLGAHYTPDIYYTQSTDVDRTKASVQTVNAGLWPPEINQKWGPLDWQPIPVHSEPLSEDSVSRKTTE